MLPRAVSRGEDRHIGGRCFGLFVFRCRHAVFDRLSTCCVRRVVGLRVRGRENTALHRNLGDTMPERVTRNVSFTGDFEYLFIGVNRLHH